MSRETVSAANAAIKLSKVEMTTRALDDLCEMLKWRRPHNTKSERQFIVRWLSDLGLQADDFGNLWRRIGDIPVLWSSHVDTVHHQGGKQSIEIRDGLIQLAASERQSNCLGADCTTGVWLMREMILAERPGLYVFHRGEEVGCLGSGWIAKERPEFLDGIQAAIAFDRKDKSDVITHQSGGRSCSDAFAMSLAVLLGRTYEPDDTGVFTDTESYADLVPECTNISVGYFRQHTASETQDVGFALWLREVLLELDTSTLVYERNPLADRYDQSDDADGWAEYLRKYRDEGTYKTTFTEDRLIDLVKRHPEEVVDFLEAQGFDVADLENYIYSARHF